MNCCLMVLYMMRLILGVITPHPISSSHSVVWTMWELVRFIVCDATH